MTSFEFNRKQIARRRDKLQNKIHNLCSTPNIIRVIKSHQMAWTRDTHGKDDTRLQNFGLKT